MINSGKTCLLIILIILSLLSTVYASEIIHEKKLLFSEIFIDDSEPNNNWVEIHNPTNETIVLQRFRTSNILAIDCLPKEIRTKGGIQIPPGGFIVICADKTKFESKWRTKVEPIVVDVLRHLGRNGFISVQTKKSGEMIYDLVLYGDDKNAYKKMFPKHRSLHFTKTGKSHKREITRSGDTLIVSEFTDSEPSPGE